MGLSQEQADPPAHDYRQAECPAPRRPAGLARAWPRPGFFWRKLAQGRLAWLVPEWQGAPLSVYLIYRHAGFCPARLRRFIGTMRHALAASADVLQAIGGGAEALSWPGAARAA